MMRLPNQVTVHGYCDQSISLKRLYVCECFVCVCGGGGGGQVSTYVWEGWSVCVWVGEMSVMCGGEGYKKILHIDS